MKWKVLKTEGSKIAQIDNMISGTAKIIAMTDNLIQDLTSAEKNGALELKNIPTGTYILFLDAFDVFPDTDFEVTVGEKEQEITLAVNQILEVNITVSKR